MKREWVVLGILVALLSVVLTLNVLGNPRARDAQAAEPYQITKYTDASNGVICYLFERGAEGTAIDCLPPESK